MRQIHIFINENFLFISIFAIFTLDVTWSIFQNLHSMMAVGAFWFCLLLFNNTSINKDELYQSGIIDGENGKEKTCEDKLYFLGHNIGYQKRLKQIFNENCNWDDET